MKDEETTIVALLHDVVEDTDYTLEDLKNYRFSDNIIEAISLMTHNDDIPYMQYIEKIKTNRIACIVKLVDLKHNSDLSRLDEITEKDLKRVDKYEKAIKTLTEAMAQFHNDKKNIRRTHLVKCQNGHFYNDNAHCDCPYCIEIHIDENNPNIMNPKTKSAEDAKIEIPTTEDDGYPKSLFLDTF